MMKTLAEQWTEHAWKNDICTNCGYHSQLGFCRKHGHKIIEYDSACPDFVSILASFCCTICGRDVTCGICMESLYNDLTTHQGWAFNGRDLLCIKCTRNGCEK